MQIQAIAGDGIMFRRLLGTGPGTGQRRFTGRAFCYPGYQSADLAYAITGHSAQGGTVHTGIALLTGAEDRQWLYPAMTRGTDMNLVFVFTTPARPADPQPGTRAAPELDRYDRTRLERQGLVPAQPTPGLGSPDPRESTAVLADVLGRDGAELSATETQRKNLANADHLATLHTIWAAETQGTRYDRYRELVMAADIELRRRHPDHVIEPLRSAEPAPSGDNGRDDLTVAPGKNIGDMAAWISALATQRQ